MQTTLRNLALTGLLGLGGLLGFGTSPADAQGYGYGQPYGGGGYAQPYGGGGYAQPYGGGGYGQPYGGGGYGGGGGGGYGGGYQAPVNQYYGNGGHDLQSHWHTTQTPLGSFAWYGNGRHDLQPHEHTQSAQGGYRGYSPSPFGGTTTSYYNSTPYTSMPW